MNTNQQNVAVIATNRTWIEASAVEQLKFTSKLPAMAYVAGMPDLHPGRGYPIGASFFSIGRFYPALIGNDIGCGMALYQTDLPQHKWSGSKLEQKIGNIDCPLIIEQTQSLFKPEELSLVESILNKIGGFGTIGGGNHFVEFQKIDEIYVDKKALCELAPQLTSKNLQLLVHSGSRGFGETILRQHIDRFNHNGLDESDENANEYWQQHNLALEFALLNRKAIAKRICELTAVKAQALEVLNVHHNFLEKTEINGKTGWLHRKGATPATQGLVMIPGSRGDYSYLVRPIPSDVSLFSLAHGAGRKWMRSDCCAKLQGLDFKDLVNGVSKQKIDNTLVCGNKELIYEEAPQAYKKVDSIIEALEHFGLVEKIARFKPVLTYKTRG